MWKSKGFLPCRSRLSLPCAAAKQIVLSIIRTRRNVLPF